MKFLRSFILSIFVLIAGGDAMAQIVTHNDEALRADSLRQEFDKRPYFG